MSHLHECPQADVFTVCSGKAEGRLSPTDDCDLLQGYGHSQRVLCGGHETIKDGKKTVYHKSERL